MAEVIGQAHQLGQNEKAKKNKMANTKYPSEWGINMWFGWKVLIAIWLFHIFTGGPTSQFMQNLCKILGHVWAYIFIMVSIFHLSFSVLAPEKLGHSFFYAG